MEIQENISLSKLSTMNIGGPARYFVAVTNNEELKGAVSRAKKEGWRWYLVGEGSNIIPPDEGFGGLIIQMAFDELSVDDEHVTVGAGHNLLALVHALNQQGLAGMERMAGIPGSVGGAIYGNAGAYGQEIKDTIQSATFFDGDSTKTLSAKEAEMGYRTSIFKKHKEWVITEATFSFSKGAPEELEKISAETIKTREEKYKPGLKCPGSFFKNIVLANMPESEQAALIKKVPEDKIMYGKIPSGYLLEEVGAKGMHEGGIAVATFHGNLIYNTGDGTAEDIKKLATTLKERVQEKFDITLEEEVQYL